jgi:hypothetical protein
MPAGETPKTEAPRLDPTPAAPAKEAEDSRIPF